MSKFTLGDYTNCRANISEILCDDELFANVCSEYTDKIIEVLEENERLKQFPIKLDNRIQKLEENLKSLKEMDTNDLNTQAVEDVAIIIGMSLNALLEFKKELDGDEWE